MILPSFMEIAFPIFFWFSSSAVGYFAAWWFCRKFLDKDDDANQLGTVSSDDVMDFTDEDKPHVPVKISKEQGLLYAWFTNNNLFVGQAETDAEIRLLVQKHLLDQLGLKIAYTYDEPEKVT